MGIETSPAQLASSIDAGVQAVFRRGRRVSP